MAVAIVLHAGAVAVAVVEWPAMQSQAPTEPSMVVELFEAPDTEEAEIPPAQDEPPAEPQPLRQSGDDPDLAPGAAAAEPPEPAAPPNPVEAPASPTPAPDATPPEELASALPTRKPAPPQQPAPQKASPAAVAPTTPGETPGQGGGDRYLNQIRDEILSQRDYPAVADPMQLSGTAIFEMMIDRSGKLLGLRLARSSGVGTLDQVGAGMIRRAAPFPPVPADIRGERIVLTLTLYVGP